MSTFANVNKHELLNAQVQRKHAAPLQPVGVIKVLRSEHTNRDVPGVPNVHERRPDDILLTRPLAHGGAEGPRIQVYLTINANPPVIVHFCEPNSFFRLYCGLTKNRIGCLASLAM